MDKKLRSVGVSTMMTVVAVIVVAAIVGAGTYMLTPKEEKTTGGEVTKSDVISFMEGASDSDIEDIVSQTVSQDIIDEMASEATGPREVTLAIEHFSNVEGTTWDGAHYRAAQRLTEKYPWLNYVYREQIGPDQTNPTAESLIGDGANIVVGSAEFMGLPLQNIAEDYPDTYFMSILASDVTQKKNFIRFFPLQYQALYLEGLIAGALTETGNIGIVSAFPCIQVLRREAGFHLGVKRAEELLNKGITIYKQYAGNWFLPTEETNIAQSLVSDKNCDVITQQTDSGSPLDVAEEQGIWFVGKDMDIVGQYGWSSTDTVAVSFDTRWEVGYETIIMNYLAGNENPPTFLTPGMDESITLADGSTLPTVDLQNDNKIGANAISPAADVPNVIIEEVEEKRAQMMQGAWDPFQEYELVSNGTGMDDAPSEGTVVWDAGEMPTQMELFSEFNFDLEGMVVVG